MAIKCQQNVCLTSGGFELWQRGFGFWCCVAHLVWYHLDLFVWASDGRWIIWQFVEMTCYPRVQKHCLEFFWSACLCFTLVTICSNLPLKLSAFFCLAAFQVIKLFLGQVLAGVPEPVVARKGKLFVIYGIWFFLAATAQWLCALHPFRYCMVACFYRDLVGGTLHHICLQFPAFITQSFGVAVLAMRALVATLASIVGVVMCIGPFISTCLLLSGHCWQCQSWITWQWYGYACCIWHIL